MSRISSGNAAAPEAALTASIDDTTDGRWQITTETGTTYLLDLDHRRLARMPIHTQLRRDHETLRLHAIVTCRIGTSAAFLVQVRDDTVPTIWLTTHVVSIERFHGVDHDTHPGGARSDQ